MSLEGKDSTQETPSSSCKSHQVQSPPPMFEPGDTAEHGYELMEKSESEAAPETTLESETCGGCRGALEGFAPDEGRKEKGGGGGVRERLKKHRRAVAGPVWIPEIWGQEELLKDWVDCSGFDASLVPAGIVSARAALVEEARRPKHSGGFRIENRCS